MGIYLNDFENQMDVFYNFAVSEEGTKGVNILLADYTYVDYEGNAFVLFEKEGKLYEVNGSHCSCYGLEGQWEPEEVLLEELIKRPKDNYYHETHKDELEEILHLIRLTGDVASVIVAMKLSL